MTTPSTVIGIAEIEDIHVTLAASVLSLPSGRYEVQCLTIRRPISELGLPEIREELLRFRGDSLREVEALLAGANTCSDLMVQTARHAIYEAEDVS